MNDIPTGETETATLVDETFNIALLQRTPCITLFNIRADDENFQPLPEKAILIPERTLNVTFNLNVLVPVAFAKALHLTRREADRRVLSSRMKDLIPLIKAYYLGMSPTPDIISYLNSDKYGKLLEEKSVKYYTDLITYDLE